MHTISQLRAEIEKNRVFAFDYEAESETGKDKDAKNPWTARPTLLSIASGNKVGVFGITEEVNQFIRELTENEELYACAHNPSYDCILAHRAGIFDFRNFNAKLWDTRVAAWMFNEEEEHGLKYLVEKYCNYKMVTYDEVMKSSPIIQEIKHLNQMRTQHQEGLELWVDDVRKAKRPFPTFNDPPVGWTKIRRMIIDKTGVDATDKDIKKRLLAKRNELLSMEERAKFEEFVNRTTPAAEARLAKLRIEQDKAFRNYAADDTLQLLKLLRKAKKKIEAEGTWAWFDNVESEVLKIYIDAEIHGLPVDVDGLREKSDVINPMIDDFLDRIHELAGRDDFNPGSDKQLCEVIFHDLEVDPPGFDTVRFKGQKISIPKLNKEGKEFVEEGDPLPDTDNPEVISTRIRKTGLSVDATCMEMITHPIGQAVLDYRTATKLRSTYVDGFLDILNSTGEEFIHGHFNPIGTKTGRTSSKNP